jgi:hypothetical protein
MKTAELPLESGDMSSNAQVITIGGADSLRYTASIYDAGREMDCGSPANLFHEAANPTVKLRA